VVKVLLSIPHRNQRYHYEIPRSTMRADKVYVNGVYWYKYWEWQGGVQASNWEKNVRELPRKIKRELKEYSCTHDVDRILQETREEYLHSVT
jgi:hypothetical protein